MEFVGILSLVLSFFLPTCLPVFVARLFALPRNLNAGREDF